jgi:hypothetical protein
MKSWKRLYARYNTTDVPGRLAEEVCFIEYLEQNNVAWKNPIEEGMPYIAGKRHYIIYVDDEMLMFLKLKFAL